MIAGSHNRSPECRMSRHAFGKNIAPYVREQIQLSQRARKVGDAAAEFFHLENAHVLGQSSTHWHTRVHVMMLGWALRHGNVREAVGQLLRIIGAALLTWCGWVPEGNTGGSNVSAFQSMPVSQEHREIIGRARQTD